MKDFAKSIHVGNADEVVHRDGDFKIKYNEKEKGYELYYKSIYYDTYHTKQQALDKIELHKKREEDRKKAGNSKVGNGLSDSYEFLMSAGKNDYNSIKEEVKKAGGWTPEIKAKARKTSDTLKKKAKELVETAHKQSAELERLAGDIESI